MIVGLLRTSGHAQAQATPWQLLLLKCHQLDARLVVEFDMEMS
jgi:hypothetical protein